MKFHSSVPLFFALLISALSLSPAHSSAALPPRTFVASNGLNTNACSRTAPCRTFDAAMAAVATGGEVIVLDSAGYGSATINKAVSLIAPAGVYASITPTGTVAIFVNTASNTDEVVLRGLALKGTNSPFGVFVTAGCHLHVENCTMDGLALGIWVTVDSSASVFVEDSTFRHCGTGLSLRTSSGLVTASVTRCIFKDNNGAGIANDSRARTTVTDSIAVGNVTAGFDCHPGDTNESAYSRMVLDHCVSAHNGQGLEAATNGGGNSAAIYVSNCTIYNNTYGALEGMGGTIYSRGNNTILGNTNNNAFVHTFSAQ